MVLANETVIEAIEEGKNLSKQLLGKNKNMTITQQLLKKAVRCNKDRQLKHGG